MNDSDEEN